MKTARLPKFDWKRVDEPNMGHTKDEWGKQEEEKSLRLPLCLMIRYYLYQQN